MGINTAPDVEAITEVLTMYEELVKDLRENHDRYFARDMEAADAIERLQCFNALWQEAAKIAHEREPKWIPVTERLPEEDKTVLTFAKKHQCILLDWMHDNKWCCYGVADYWMSLPEPPEEET